MSLRLPDFLVIGGMRCGSTSLYNVLSGHPQIFMPENKELHFFDRRNPDLPNIQAYKATFLSCPDNHICGEVTPDYLTTPGCLDRIEDCFDSLKLIVILRDPVARAKSHYLMSVAAGFEVLPFPQAIEQESYRLAHRDDIADIFHSYQERSDYLPFLQAYEKKFGRENMHILVLENLNKQPHMVLNELWRFLQVSPTLNNDQIVKISNANGDLISRAQNKEQETKRRVWWRFWGENKSTSVQELASSVMDETLQELDSAFENKNRRLSEWLEEPLPW